MLSRSTVYSHVVAIEKRRMAAMSQQVSSLQVILDDRDREIMRMGAEIRRLQQGIIILPSSHKV